jgi:D-sedoheptulose 7-phosphate isomerase
MKQKIEKYIAKHKEMISQISDQHLKDLENLGEKLIESLKKGGKLIVFGNGGSAADAQHFACEFVGSFINKKRKALPAIALNTNTSSITSISNDFTYDSVFSRQIEAFAVPGDVCIGISTSGNSKNVYKALKKAGEMRCFTSAFLGGDGGIIADISICPIILPSDHTPIIQEGHIMFIHILCGIVDDAFSE